MTWLLEHSATLVHMVLLALCALTALAIGALIWHGLIKTCARRSLVSVTGAALLAFAIGLLPTIAKRSGTTGVPPVDVAQERVIPGDAYTGGTRSGASAPYFTGISTTPTSVWLSAAWPPSLFSAGGWLYVQATHELQTNMWETIGYMPVAPAETNAEVEVLSVDLPDGTNSRAFFRLDAQPVYDPTVCDTDGDGLTDEEETGSISVLSSFEWHDTSAFPPRYSPTPSPPWVYEILAFGMELPGCPVIQGLPCPRAEVGENGFVSLVTPGDGRVWTIPVTPSPLEQRGFDMGTILVAPYWGNWCVHLGNTNSFIRAGTLADGTTVIEFHDIKRGRWSDEGMTCQVIVPGGTGDVVRVSYLSSDVLIDGSDGIAGVHNTHRVLPDGSLYNLKWDFSARGSILPGTTVEYRLGTGTDPESADSDGDWLDDATELYETGTDPWKPDTDNDGIEDGDEVALGTNPLSPDTDGDGLPDAWEVSNGLDPTSAAGDDGASGDPDGDGLTNAQERQLGTAPQDPDTDNDGLDDDVEIALGTDPLNADTDGDGLLDGYEVNELGSSPFLHDTDGDGLDDEEEDVLGTNPNSGDTDGDGMDDQWEHLYGFDPTVHYSQTTRTDDDGDTDPDNDGLTNLDECALGTNPLLADTDGDGLSDYAEVVGGTSPCYADTDGDGLDDLQEQTITTNPLQPDTDGDGMDDGWEHQHGFDPKTHNTNTVRTDDDANADPDRDGLTNAVECKWRTNPSGADANSDGIPDGLDTDGDGVADGVEIVQNSDPADASDGGQPGSRVPVPFYFGDHSGSHSEKYLLTVVPVANSGVGSPPRTFSCVNALYGECETQTNMLKRGWRYEVRLRHAGTNPTYMDTPRPDYDYTIQLVTDNLPPNVQVSDPDLLFGVDNTSTSFSAKNKTAMISVYEFTVEEIKFNHEMVSCATDAVNIRQNANLPFDMSHGEWWLGGESLKNDPVCYIGGIRPVVKVKFRVSPELNSARFSASTLDSDSPLRGLGAKNVIFENGVSDWIEFQMDSAIDRTVRKFDHRWEWKVSRMNGTAVAEFVCATTGPHKVYVIRDQPVAPAWRMTAGNTKNPWTNALDFVCGLANRQSDAHSALSTITSHLFYNMWFRYDTTDGQSHYLKNSTFDLSSYLSKRYALVNCYDQAYAIATLANLLGVAAKVIEVRPFGYINPVNLIGHGFCNNPGFYEANDRMRPLDDATRSRFKTHTFAMFDSQVYDACIGPITGLGYIPYLLQTIDYSTADEQYLSALSEDERVIPLKKVETHEVYLLK